MIKFRYLQPEDAPSAAALHVEGQPGTVLTQLGKPFLTQLYRAVAYSEWGEGIGAFDGDRLVAQTAMAVSSAKFFSEFKWKYLWQVSLPASVAVARNPSIVSNVVKGWSYADQTRSPEREGDVIFLGVTRDYMRHGLGPEIVRYMFGWANLIGLKSANFMVEKRNRPMRWMISNLNDLYVAHEFEAYGRTMLFYKIPIAANLGNAMLPDGKPYRHAHIYSKNGRI
jgi:GNAT superfamily N-acetyltransferase